jgi:hypothetical protein
VGLKEWGGAGIALLMNAPGSRNLENLCHPFSHSISFQESGESPCLRYNQNIPEDITSIKMRLQHKKKTVLTSPRAL